MIPFKKYENLKDKVQRDDVVKAMQLLKEPQMTRSRSVFSKTADIRRICRQFLVISPLYPYDFADSILGKASKQKNYPVYQK